MTCVMFNFEKPLPLAFQAPSRFLYNEENRQVIVMKNITSDNVVQELWKVNADT